jgi:broad specificity phosphatase PhoE
MKQLALFVAIILSTVVEGKLFQVVSLFRHGARFHINGYYDGNSTKPLWGELSAVGMRQHESLGHMIRRDYMERLGFLDKKFTTESIKIISTDVNRTI